jgi:hypothetical protein
MRRGGGCILRPDRDYGVLGRGGGKSFAFLGYLECFGLVVALIVSCWQGMRTTRVLFLPRKRVVERVVRERNVW